MRILWDNKIDDASAITSSSEATGFADDNVQDPRLAVRWRSTASASEWIKFDAGGPARQIFGSVANLVSNPEDLSASAWSTTTATASAAGLSANGFDLTKVTITTATAPSVFQEVAFTGTAAKAGQLIMQRGTNDEDLFLLYDASAASRLAAVYVDWASNVAAATAGALVVNRWLDDDTVLLAVSSDAVTPTAQNLIQIIPGGDAGGTAGGYVYVGAVQAEDNVWPRSYVDGSVAAVDVTDTFELPPAKTFTVDTVVRPWFTYDTASDHYLWSWVAGTAHLLCYYNASADLFNVDWKDGGTVASLASAQFDDGTAEVNLYQRLRVIASIDFSAGGVTTGSRLIVIPLGSGTVSEDTTWGTAIDALSSTFATLAQGNDSASGQFADAEQEYLRVYAGTLAGTVASSSDATDLLDAMDLIYNQTDQAKWLAQAAGIAGHNLSAGAVVKVEGNDWDLWSTSQSLSAASRLVQETLTWRADIVLKFITEAERQFWRFTVVDPNNADGYVEAGRFYLGKYLQVTPTSFIEFPTEHSRSDRFQYSQGRQLYADVGLGTRQVRYQFPDTSAAQKKLMEAMWDDRGMHGPVIFTNYDSAYWSRIPPMYAHIASPVTFISRGDRWRYDLQLQEVL